jgi:predicted DsbA family dithiol-disulfide isomerase
MNRVLLSFLVLFVVGCAATTQLTQSPTPAAPVPVATNPVATFSGGTVTQAQAEAMAGPQLVKARQEEFRLLVDGVRRQAADELSRREAAKAGISLEEYLKRSIADKAGQPDKAEIERTLQQYRGRLPEDETEARAQVVGFLSQGRTQAREQAFRSELLSAAGFRLLLEPPRLDIAVGPGDPTNGSADAPVTIVEFTDFQCPFCERVQPAMQRIRKEYAGRVRIVAKQLPLPFHEQARGAAEAVLCAAAGGRFWEMYDWLFAHQGGATPDAIKKAAEAMKLDSAAFAACVDTKATAAKVNADMALAERFGITGTPAAVVNGVLIEGAQPFETFQQAIDDELVRRASRVGSGGR